MDRQWDIDSNETKMTYNHRIWMAHVILCLIWLKGGQLDECLQGVVIQTLDWRGWSMATDYILVLCLSLGIPIHADGLPVTHKRYFLVVFCCQIGEQGFGAYRRLAFETSVNNFFDRLEVLPVGDVVGPFKPFPAMGSDTVASQSYNFFHRLVNLPSFGMRSSGRPLVTH